MAVDAGGVDAGSDRPELTDAQPTDQDWSRADTGRDSGVMDSGADTGAADATEDRPAEVDAGRCPNGPVGECDGRNVSLVNGERDGGLVHFCGACGVTCAAGEVCDACRCAR